MKVLLDTNVLARLAQPSHRHHRIAAQAVETIRTRGDEICVVPQVLYELWVVCTRPTGEIGLGMSVTQAQAESATIKRLATVLRDERAIFQEWEQLVSTHDVKGKNAHDARLVAAMLRHGITHILTLNEEDFRRFTEIVVVAPTEIMSAAGGGSSSG
jgi:predicted nucleic acid-binding protein